MTSRIAILDPRSSILDPRSWRFVSNFQLQLLFDKLLADNRALFRCPSSGRAVKLGYHNSMNSMGERRLEVDRIMNATDPKYVWAVIDIAHMRTADGDPVQFTRDYLNRLVYSHFKDVLIQKTPPGLDGRPLRPKYDFVELGQGVVNIPSVLQILKDFRYQGWVIIELDRATGGRTPKESAVISKKFVEERLKLKI